MTCWKSTWNQNQYFTHSASGNQITEQLPFPFNDSIILSMCSCVFAFTWSHTIQCGRIFNRLFKSFGHWWFYVEPKLHFPESSGILFLFRSTLDTSQAINTFSLLYLTKIGLCFLCKGFNQLFIVQTGVRRRLKSLIWTHASKLL